ncbi:MAG: hypothetical protein J7L66_02360 [Anaerolineaceae bacterium]|nr:hypothetical protein [Anaerolineaceae bacterium]
MDEIICPKCGRPNLIEAKKCWFCQTILEKSQLEDTESSLDESKTDYDSSKIISSHDNNTDEQDIPEWLQRIRALKEADGSSEEKSPDWEQQDLFPGKKKIQRDKKSAQKGPLSPKINKKPATRLNPLIENKPKSHPTLGKPSQKQEEAPAEKPDIKIDSLSEELPEGFTKL